MRRCDNHVAGSKMQTALDQDLPPMGAGETVPPPMGAEETYFPTTGAFEAVYLPIRTNITDPLTMGAFFSSRAAGTCGPPMRAVIPMMNRTSE